MADPYKPRNLQEEMKCLRAEIVELTGAIFSLIEVIKDE